MAEILVMPAAVPRLMAIGLGVAMLVGRHDGRLGMLLGGLFGPHSTGAAGISSRPQLSTAKERPWQSV